MARLSKQLALVAVLLAVFALATSVSALPMRMRRVEMHGAAVVPKLRPRQRTAQIPSLVSPRPRPTQLAAQPAAAAECDNTVIEIEDVFFGPILGVPDAQTNQCAHGAPNGRFCQYKSTRTVQRMRATGSCAPPQETPAQQ